VKKQHETPSLEQQTTKLSKQEKHYKKKPPRQKPTTKQNDKKKFGPIICLPYLYSWSVETTPIHTQQLHIATTNLNLIFFVFPNLKPSLIGLTKQHEPRALFLFFIFMCFLLLLLFCIIKIKCFFFTFIYLFIWMQF
jgi:hypothetical protein